MPAFRQLASLTALISFLVATPLVVVAQDRESAQFPVLHTIRADMAAHIDTALLIAATETTSASAFEFTLADKARDARSKRHGPKLVGLCKACDVARQMVDYQYRRETGHPLFPQQNSK